MATRPFCRSSVFARSRRRISSYRSRRRYNSYINASCFAGYYRSVLHLAPNFLITEIEIEEWKLLGEKWLECADDIKQIEIVWDEIENKFWKKIIECTDESNPSIKAGEHYKLVKRPNPEILNWWRPAVALLAISDEACSGLGFINKYSDGKYRRHTLERAIIRSKFNKTESFRMKTNSDYKHCVYVRPLTSYTDAIDTSLIRVVPKSTVPTVGCTLRTISHNLAAVPPIGVVDVSWCSGPSETHVSEGPLNILAIPFPFTNSRLGISSDLRGSGKTPPHPPNGGAGFTSPKRGCITLMRQRLSHL